MKAVVFCEGTTDLLMIQFILQYKYGWRYSGFLENAETNRLIRKTLVKDDASIEIRNCGGITNIPNKMRLFQEQMEFSTRQKEFFDKVLVLIDHDTVDSNKAFVKEMNEKLRTNFEESDLNTDRKWKIKNLVAELELDLYICCIPQNEIGAIESIMLEALATDSIEKTLVEDSREFISQMARKQSRYLQKKALIAKAVFNTYFAIRTPEEKYDERARVLKAYDWEHNEVLNRNFSFLDV